MLTLACDIRIGAVRTRAVTEVVVNSAWRELTDTCAITLPRNLLLRDRPLLEYFSVGDRVSVQLGYVSSGLRTVFEGYVARISPETPVVIECEDAMWLLKKGSVSQAWSKGVRLPELVPDIVGDRLPIARVDDFNLGKVEINQATPAQVLEDLKENGVFAYIRNGQLEAGFAYDPNTTPRRVAFNYHRNLIPPVGLQFKRAEDQTFRAKATSFNADNTQISVEVGDPDGALRTFTYQDLTEAELRAAAERDLTRVRVDGYTGDFLAFGVPAVAHGDVVELTDPQYPERGGSYFVDAVQTTFGQGGFRQQVTLGKAAG